MNRSYRIVFNRSSGLWQVVSELARSHGKGRGQANTVCAIEPKARQAANGSGPHALRQLIALLASVFAMGSAQALELTGEYLIDGQNYIFGRTKAGSISFQAEPTAYFDAQNLILGQQPGGDGTLSISGSTYSIGSYYEAARFIVGAAGTGTVNLKSGGVVRITSSSVAAAPPKGPLILGELATGRGTLNIGGQAGAPAESGGTLVATAVQFGAGTGVVNFNVTEEYDFTHKLVSLSPQGTHTVNQIAGTTRLTGDSSAYAGAVNVRGGTLKIENKLGASAALIDAGTAAGAQAAVIASGAQTDWLNTGNLLVGKTGPGSLTVKDGAKVSNQFGVVNAPTADTAWALVSGTNSVWDNKEALTVGNAGHGSVTVNTGGLLKSQDGVIGQDSNSTGKLTVTGAASSWQNSGALRVGDVNSQGELRIEAGAAVSNTDALVGSMGGTGRVTVTGAGSTWLNHGTVKIASGIGNGNGTLTIANGGEVRVGPTGGGVLSLGTDGVFPVMMPHGVLNIGAAAGEAAQSAGQLTAGSVQLGTGKADINFNHTSTTYLFSTALNSVGNGNQHSVNQLAGTTILTGDNSAFKGAWNVSGGKLMVLGALGGGASVQSGGTLQLGNGLVGASTSLSKDLSVTGTGSTLAIYGSANLKALANTVTLGAGTQLNILTGANGPALQAKKVELGNNVTFRLQGIADASQLTATLIQTTDGITGDFATVDVGGFQGTVDYLTVRTAKSSDNRQYLATYAPSWIAANNLAHGTFTLTNSTDSFEMGMDLTDQAANTVMGWDGKRLTKSGAGTLVLSGNNTYSGGTALNSGTLQVGSATNLGTGGLTFNGGTLYATESMALSHAAALQQNATLNVSGDKTLTLNGVMQGTADLIKAGAGTLSLTNNANNYANTRVMAGTLIGHAASISGNLYNNGTTIFSQSSNDQYSGTISGTGALIKQGAGALLLSGDHSGFTGATTVAGGTLLLQNKLGGSANVTAGTLQFGDGTIGAASTLRALTVSGANSTLALRGPATLSVNGAAELGDNTVLDIGVGAAAPTLYAHRMTLGQNIVLKLGGIASPSMVNRILIDTRDGISGDFATVSIGGFTGDVDFMSVHTSKSADQRQYLASYGLSWNTGNNLSHGTFTLSQASDQFDISANLSDQPANTLTQWNGSSLTKAGLGTLVLSGQNTYSGGTFINRGIVQVSQDANLGAASGAVTLDGGYLNTSASFSSARAINLVRTSGLGVASGTTLELSGVIAGTGALHKTSAGTLALSGINTFSGDIIISSGIVQVKQNANLGAASGGVTLNGGTLATAASFNSARAFNLAHTSSLNVAANTTLGLSGVISNTGALHKTGAGTLALSGQNTYQGGTTLAQGTVQVGQNANLGSGALDFQGGTLQTTASFNMTRDLALTQAARLDVTTGTTLGLSGQLTGSGNLIKSGTGTLRLSNTANAYAHTQVMAGTLIGNAASISGNIANSGALVFDQATNGVFNGVLSGAGTFTKTGAGTLDLTATNLYTGSTTVQAGTLRVGSNANLGAASAQLILDGGSLATNQDMTMTRSIELAQNGALDIAAQSTLNLNGTISGPGALIQKGGGTLVLAGANTYAGGTQLQGGVLRISQDASLGATTGTVTFDGGQLAASQSFTSSRAIALSRAGHIDVAVDKTLGLNGLISGGGMVSKSGQGILQLNNDNTFSGGVFLGGGTVQVARDANLGAASGSLTLSGGTLATTASFNSARSAYLSHNAGIEVASGTTLGLTGLIDGTGALHKTGAGTLALSGQNTYLGGTVINGGIVQINQDANLGAANGAVSLNGGTLASTASFNSARAFNLTQTGSLNVAANTTLGLSGVMDGTGALHKTGAGTLILSGVNTFGGGTTLAQGTMQIGQNANLGSGALDFQGGTLQTTASFNMTRNLALTQAARLDVTTGTTLGLSGQLAGTGDLIKTGAGTLRLSNAANAYAHTQIVAGTLIGNTGAISGNIANSGALVFEQAANGTFNGILSGSGSTLKTGAGALTLAGLSAGYTGHTTVNGGALAVLGTLGGSASVSSGTLQFGNGVTGAASSLSDNLTVSGAGSALSVQGPATLTVADAIQMRDNTTLDLAAGSAALQADQLTLGQNVAFILGGIANSSQLGKVLINTQNGIQGDFASVRVGGFNGTVDYMTVNTQKSADQKQYLASYDLSWTAANNLSHGTFTLTDAANRFVLGAALGDQAANAATGWNGTTLTKAGAGTLVLTGNNGYTGGTVLAGGTLQVDRDANLGATNGTLSFQGGALATTDSFNSARAISLAQAGTLNVATNTTLGLSGVIGGTGTLYKTGAGILALSGQNTYQGDIVINGGTVQVSQDANLGAASGAVNLNGGTLATTASFNSARAFNLAQTGDLNVAANTTLGLSGVIDGTGALHKTGAGTLALSGQNTYLGGTVINSGIVQINQDANLGAATGAVSLNGGTLASTASFNSARAFNLTQTGSLNVAANTTLGLSGVMGGTGALHKTGAGTLALSGVNTFSGGTTLAQGIVQIGQNANLGSGTLDFQGGTLQTNASLDMTRNLALTQAARLDVATGTTLGLSGQLSGAGDLIKTGAGTLRLSNTANAYAHTQIVAGTLIGNAGAISGNIVNSGALVFEQAANGTFNGILSGSGSTLKTGAGALTLAGLSAGYAGHTTVAGGTLAVLGTLGGSANVSNGTLQFGNGVTGAASSLSDNLTVSGAGSTLSVQGPATLTVADAIQMRDGTQLDLVAGPGSAALQADSLTLGQDVTFTLGGIADSSQLGKVLINTQNGIQGGFASVRVGGFNGAVDYLNLNTHTSADKKQLLASYNLSWTAANNLAHGTFTLADAANRFVVSTGLSDQAANTSTGWNGTTLTKAGAGTLVLTGNNSYTGGTILTGGTLQVDRDANLGAANGKLSFQGGTLATQGSFTTARDITLVQDGRFDVNAGTTLTLAGTINGHADLIKSGSGSLRLANSANAYQTTRILAGTLIGHAGVIPGNVANHGTLIMDQADNATYSGSLSGDGELIKTGPGILHLTGDSSGFTGNTTVQSGKIAMNGLLGGSSIIGAGSVLGGSGVIGSGPGTSMTIASGGTLSPGNSIGTLTIAGDLNIQPGARFAVETQPQGTVADLVKVTGNATLNGGSVAHIGANGQYDLRSSYTILAADGTLTGRFDDVTSDFAFLTPSLNYDYNAGRVALLLERNERAMDSAAQTRNQRATAHAIDGMGAAAAHGVYDAIAQLPNNPDMLRAGFDGLSGEIHASAKSVLLEDSQHIRNTINERLRSATQAVASSTLAVRTNDGELAPGHAAGTSTWIQATGAWRDTDSDGNAADLSSSSSGFLMGVDSKVSDAVRLGLLAGYNRTDIDVDDRASSARSDNYHLGAYGGAQWGALGLRSGLAYSWHDISSRRDVAVPGLSEKLKADYKANSTQIFADLGYRIDTAPVALEPFAQLAYVRLQTKGFQENGGAAALQAKRQSAETTFATLGVRAMSDFELGGAQASVRGSLGWRHASGTLNPTATHAFSAGSAFTVAGSPIAKNSALMQAGLDVQLNRSASVGVAYQGQVARSAQDHSVQARLNIRF